MFSSKTCFLAICILSLSLSTTTAETVRGAPTPGDRVLHNGHFPTSSPTSVPAAAPIPAGTITPPPSESLAPSASPVTDKVPKVLLGAAADYAVLTKAGVTNDPGSRIIGNIGVSPIALSAVTGFAYTVDPSGLFATSSQTTGHITSASMGTTTAVALTTAVGNMETAYTDAAGRPAGVGPRLNMAGGLLGGDYGGPTAPLTPGIYTFSTGVTLVTDIYLSGTGTGADQGETDVFIIQIAGFLKLDTGVQVFLTNGALAENVFWQVANYADLQADSFMQGNLLVKTHISFVARAGLYGRALAQTAVTLVSNTIVNPNH
jgi:hypothetical protein